jgi:hypothetical protein
LRHLVPPFDKLTRAESIEVEKKVIEVIRAHMLFGTAITVDERDYNTWSARRELGTAYSYCCWQTIASVNVWMDQNDVNGEVAYFFEAGHDSAGETGAIMNLIAREKESQQRFRYASHAFVKKERVRPLQTADIFAWLHANHLKRIRRGESRPRADYVALTKGRPHKAFIATRETVASELVTGHPHLSGFVPSWVKA